MLAAAIWGVLALEFPPLFTQPQPLATYEYCQTEITLPLVYRIQCLNGTLIHQPSAARHPVSGSGIDLGMQSIYTSLVAGINRVWAGTAKQASTDDIERFAHGPALHNHGFR